MSFIRTLLGGLMFLLALAFVFWLVFSNSQPETVRLVGMPGTQDGGALTNPFAGAGDDKVFKLPLGMWYVGFTVLGLFFGLFAGWFIGGSTRIKARQQGRRARTAEKELKTVKQEKEVAKTEVDSLKTEKKDLETKVKDAEAVALNAPADVKKITSA